MFWTFKGFRFFSRKEGKCLGIAVTFMNKQTIKVLKLSRIVDPLKVKVKLETWPFGNDFDLSKENLYALHFKNDYLYVIYIYIYIYLLIHSMLFSNKIYDYEKKLYIFLSTENVRLASIFGSI